MNRQGILVNMIHYYVERVRIIYYIPPNTFDDLEDLTFFAAKLGSVGGLVTERGELETEKVVISGDFGEDCASVGFVS